MSQLGDVIRKNLEPGDQICELTDAHAVVTDCSCGVGYQIFLSDLYLAPGEVLVFTIHGAAGSVAKAKIKDGTLAWSTPESTIYHLPSQSTRKVSHPEDDGKGY